jgi:hypothetical protein
MRAKVTAFITLVAIVGATVYLSLYTLAKEAENRTNERVLNATE